MMEHKAFIFDYQKFEQELLPILQDALATGECSALISFIQQNIESLTDPYEGEPLEDDWEGMIETEDAHQYGDFALTKYYDPTADIGLGSAWESVQEIVPDDRRSSPILGLIVGSDNDPFDPGKMGSYFQSNGQVSESFGFLQQLAQEHSSEEVNEAVELLQRATQAQKGLYVTF
ncbi:hypothetical protein [Blastopirellula retiformator]|uniref:Uncharacterized protein n=1 Tax=Blastopirellula retiformator TaxID=2527970 RepID=A0A5C5US05_9BACT|nr:hypothetical protein [Blastopirellula retiformator]TWT29251.1 hypothetical protein Enr8_51140 [Blastopirellula retiformator]